jgi:hypothetical protein
MGTADDDEDFISATGFKLHLLNPFERTDN